MARAATATAATPNVKGRKPAAARKSSGEVDPVVARLMGPARLWGEGQIRIYEKTPPGDYDAEVTDFAIDDDGNCRLKMVIDAENADGKSQKYYPTRFYTFNRNGESNTFAIGDFKTDMARTGVEPPPDNARLEEIAAAMVEWGRSMVNRIVRIRVTRTQDKQGRIDEATGEVREYENVYVQRLVA